MSLAEAAQAVATAAEQDARRLEMRYRNRRLLELGDSLMGRLEELRLAGVARMDPALAQACLDYRNAILDEERTNWPARSALDAAYNDVEKAVDVVLHWLQPLRPENEDG